MSFATVKSGFLPHFRLRLCRPKGGRGARIEECTSTLCDRRRYLHCGIVALIHEGCGPKGACTRFTYLPLLRRGDTTIALCMSLNTSNRYRPLAHCSRRSLCRSCETRPSVMASRAPRALVVPSFLQ